MIDYDILLDMKKPGCIDTGFEFCQGDKEILALNILLKNGSSNYVPSGDVTVVFKKPSGETESGILIKNGDAYRYEIRGSELSEPGPVIAEVKTYDSDTGRATSSRFKFLVKADLENFETTDTKPYIGELEIKIIEANELINQLTQSRDEALQMIEDLQGENFITNSAIVDNLLSTDNTKVLSANQGRIIGEALEDFETELNATNDNLANFQLELAKLFRQTFSATPPEYNASFVLRNESGTMLGLTNNADSSYIAICQTRASSNGYAIYSIVFSASAVNIQTMLATSINATPILAATGGNNVYIKTNGAATATYDILLIKTR